MTNYTTEYKGDEAQTKVFNTHKDLVYYVETHSRTDRAQFHGLQLDHFFWLAGVKTDIGNQFVSFHYEEAKPYIEIALRNLSTMYDELFILD